MKTGARSLVPAIAVFALIAGSCGGGDAATTTTTTTQPREAHTGPVLTLDAPTADITVDGDPSDWDGIAALDLTLEPITTESVDAKDAHVKVAQDAENVYVLFEVDDDYDWVDGDERLSGAPSVMWLVDDEAGAHMGTDSEGKESNYQSFGMVDIWHWRLGCGPGVPQGGAALTEPSADDPSDDPNCNFDDEYSTDPLSRYNDDGEGAENSLLGVFGHSNPVNGEAGTWYFEFSRPLQTGDVNDAQFTAGEVAKLALAYWDADNGETGWDKAEHVQSSYLGWIEVQF